MISTAFTEFLIISIVSLAITFVLFNKLDSYATGKTKILGGSIKYGGALGGFILIFYVIFYSYSTVIVSDEKTNIDINGKWEIQLVTMKGEERSGRATIYQKKRSVRLQVAGDVESTTTPPSVSFSSLVAVLKGRRLVFLYENSRREMGIALGDIQSNKPKVFTIYYYDVLSSDTNNDPEGRIIFSRIE